MMATVTVRGGRKLFISGAVVQHVFMRDNGQWNKSTGIGQDFTGSDLLLRSYAKDSLHHYPSL